MSEDKDRPDLRLVDGQADPVLRRQRFEHAHPEAVILVPSARRWRAVVPPGQIPAMASGPLSGHGIWAI